MLDDIWSITPWKINGETVETMTGFILGAPKSLQMVTAAMKLKDAAPWKKSHDQPRQHIKKQRHYFANKVCLVKAWFFQWSCVDVKVGL